LAGFFGVGLLFGLVDNGYVTAFRGEVHGHRTADAAVAAGDEGGLAFEFAAAAVVLPDELGLGRHFFFDARLLALVLGGYGIGFTAHRISWFKGCKGIGLN
jgi:hypothetical protein